MLKPRRNDALRMMLPLVVVGCTSAVCQSGVAASGSAWIMQPPRLADTAERIISPSGERLITMQKQLANPEVYYL